MKSFEGVVTLHGDETTVSWQPDGGGFVMTVGGRSIVAQGRQVSTGTYIVTVPGQEPVRVVVSRDGQQRYVTAGGVTWELSLRRGIGKARPRNAVGDRAMASPMPGVVIGLDVAVGDQVKKGAVLMRIEAMKMEHAIVAPRDGVVSALHFRLGDPVAAGAHLVELSDEEAAIEAKGPSQPDKI